jgi:hypothetical protein
MRRAWLTSETLHIRVELRRERVPLNFGKTSISNPRSRQRHVTRCATFRPTRLQRCACTEVGPAHNDFLPRRWVEGVILRRYLLAASRLYLYSSHSFVLASLPFSPAFVLRVPDAVWPGSSCGGNPSSWAWAFILLYRTRLSVHVGGRCSKFNASRSSRRASESELRARLGRAWIGASSRSALGPAWPLRVIVGLVPLVVEIQNRVAL